MEYLNADEIKRAKMCIANIEDKLNAVKTEILSREKPYKDYLKEKLDSMNWDVQVLISMIEKEDM